MYSELFYLIVTLGVLVLVTYVEAFRSRQKSLLWGGLPQYSWYRNPWVLSMVVTVLSFLYMASVWVFTLEGDDIVYEMSYKEIRHIVLLQYTLFMAGAVLWAPLTLIALHRREKMWTVLLALWLTASGSIGLFVMACGLQNWRLIAASLICMLHHVGFDAIYWWRTWEVAETKTLVNIVARGSKAGKKVEYDTLQFI